MVNGKRAQALFLFICYNDYGGLMIDYEKLRKDLIDYFGTAMSFNPMAIMDLS